MLSVTGQASHSTLPPVTQKYLQIDVLISKIN